MLKTCQFNSL